MDEVGKQVTTDHGITRALLIIVTKDCCLTKYDSLLVRSSETTQTRTSPRTSKKTGGRMSSSDEENYYDMGFANHGANYGENYPAPSWCVPDLATHRPRSPALAASLQCPFVGSMETYGARPQAGHSPSGRATVLDARQRAP